MYHENKSSATTVKFRQASNRGKRVLEAVKLAYVNKTESILNKDKVAVPPLFNSPGVFSFASDKTKLFAETLYENSNLDDSYIF